MSIARPRADEFAPYYGTYVNAVEGDDALAALERQRESSQRFLRGIPEARSGFRYSPDKWSIREVIGHVSDAERIFCYRLLRIARGDETPLSSFDENAYVPAGGFDRRSLADVAAELAAVRDATLALAKNLDDIALLRIGTASGKRISARALAWIIAGHEAHHIRVLGERYLGDGRTVGR
ncbi:MAG: DinB family protein [Gemmatimonadota bacterium]|nr:DinB family protein [Gemmatimonadota bacterium]MDH4347169.1 DinB family protein [Gemmatimonadota bacterium]MDH5284376.1 DinB family protein [Gemmatimonadota bacterium]